MFTAKTDPKLAPEARPGDRSTIEQPKTSRDAASDPGEEGRGLRGGGWYPNFSSPPSPVLPPYPLPFKAARVCRRQAGRAQVNRSVA